MKNAIVILNYNDYETCITLVENIKDYKKLNKIIIVDNNSTDKSFEKLIERYISFEKIDVIKTINNNGYAFGNNFGINYAIDKYKVDIVFVANPDVYFEENVIEEIENVFDDNNEIGVLAPKVSKGYNSWKLPEYKNVLASVFLYLNKKFGNYVYKNQNEKINFVEVVAGSLFSIRANVFKMIDGFDERTFLYYEENILGFKLKQNKIKSAILGNVFYDHNHATSIKKVFKSKIKVFKIAWNSIRIYAYEYLKINYIQRIFLDMVYIIALIERYLYDIYNKVKMRFYK